MLNILKNCQIALWSSWTIFYFHQQNMRVLISPDLLCQNLSSFKITIIIVDVKYDLIYICLWCWAFFICLLAIYILSVGKYLFKQKSLCPFFNCSFVTTLFCSGLRGNCWVVRFLYISWIQVHYYINNLQILFPILFFF